MKPCPTSGPIINSSSKNARDASNSRNSFASSVLSERKKNFLQTSVAEAGLLPQFRYGPLARHVALAQQHHPVAYSRAVRQLMNRNKPRPPLASPGPQTP